MIERWNRPRAAHTAANRLASLMLAVLLVSILAGCGQAAPATSVANTSATQPLAATATQVPPAATATPTAVIALVSSPTLTLAASPTPRPSSTPTTPPTATQVPELALLADGFEVWCAPLLKYAGSLAPASPQAVPNAYMPFLRGERWAVNIPAAYCVVSVRFNQPAPEGMQLYFFDAGSPFMRLALRPSADSPEQLWTVVNHPYVLDPPFWEVTYRLAVVSQEGKELWSNPVIFAKILPKECPFGGLPHPVTLQCAVTDPWEIEPFPDVTYPYDHDKLPTPSD